MNFICELYLNKALIFRKLKKKKKINRLAMQRKCLITSWGTKMPHDSEQLGGHAATAKPRHLRARAQLLSLHTTTRASKHCN